jgi:AAA15 family ATPase/GTPase
MHRQAGRKASKLYSSRIGVYNITKTGGIGAMLISFTMENVLSFKEEVTLDMRATAIKAHSYSLISTEKHKLLPVVAIYGANASGKTNLIRGLKSMQSSVLDKLDICVPFALEPSGKMLALIRFETHFIVLVDEDWIECNYGLSVDSRLQGMLSYFKEELMCKTPSGKKLTLVYLRKWDSENKKWILKTGSSPLAKSVANEVKYCNDMETGQFSLLLTALGKRGNASLFMQIFSWVKGIAIQEEALNPPKVYSSVINKKEDIFTFLENKKAYNALLLFVQSVNPLIKSILLGESETYDIFKTNAEEKQLTFDYEIERLDKHELNGIKKEIRSILISVLESKGVWTAIRLYPKIYNVLQNGGLLVVDELENSLHPLLMAKIINMFTSPETNPGHGQLIFTTHNVLLMDKKYFRQDEIVFVDKDMSSGNSSIYRLSDIDGVRSDLDFCKNYIYGAFGAIPDFSEGEGDELT